MCTSDAVGRCDDVIVALLHSLLQLLFFSVSTFVSVSDSLGFSLKHSKLFKVFDFISVLDFFWFITVPQVIIFISQHQWFERGVTLNSDQQRGAHVFFKHQSSGTSTRPKLIIGQFK